MTTAIPDPFELFRQWFEQAQASESADVDAGALATVSESGAPSIRMVLVRGITDDGFTFYTNLESRKAHHLAVNANAALCFHWKSTERQIRIEGVVEQVSDQVADAYFSTRPRESQIGAWASKQSQLLDDRRTLEARVKAYSKKFESNAVPRPEFWSGYLLKPNEIEFWDKRPFRLHDRTRFRKTGLTWSVEKLYP